MRLTVIVNGSLNAGVEDMEYDRRSSACFLGNTRVRNWPGMYVIGGP